MGDAKRRRVHSDTSKRRRWEEAEGHVRLELKSALKSVFGTRCGVLFNSTKQGLITLYGLYSVEPDPMGNHQGGVSFEKMKERCPPAAVSLLEDAASHSLKLGKKQV